MQGLCSISAHLWALEKAGVRQPKAAAQNEPRSRPKLHQGPHCGEATMRHHVDIFQQQLRYETLAAVATPLQMNNLLGHRRLMVETLKELKLLVLGLVGC